MRSPLEIVMRRMLSTTLGLLLTMTVVSGCNILVPANYILEGTGTLPAEHDLEPVKTLVFVDDQTNVLPRTVLRSNLAAGVSTALLTQELVPETVDSNDAMAMVRSRERNGQRMSCESIAKETGAPQLIFIEMETFSLTEDGWITRPSGSCLVKVLDFKKGDRVYPIGELGDAGGRRVSVTLREIAPEKMRSAADRRQAQMLLVADLATAVVKLFHEHQRLDLGENLGVR